METITKEYTLYTFDELSDDIQEKVLDNNRDINTDFDGWETFTLEDKTNELIEYGFHNPEILYSGFWSQGDGACFTGSLDNDGLLKFLEKTQEKTKYKKIVRAIESEKLYVSIKITHNFQYYHEYSTSIEDYTEMQDNSELPEPLQKEWDAFMLSFSEGRGLYNGREGWYYDQCQSIYKALEDTYNYLTSDEAVKDTTITNEYTFLENGKPFTA